MRNEKKKNKTTLRVSFQIELKKSRKKVKAFFDIAARLKHSQAERKRPTVWRLSKRSIKPYHSHFLCCDFFVRNAQAQEATWDKFPMLNLNESRVRERENLIGWMIKRLLNRLIFGCDQVSSSGHLLNVVSFSLLNLCILNHPSRQNRSASHYQIWKAFCRGDFSRRQRQRWA